MSTKTQTFEASLEQLEKIVRKLEDGDLPLEDSLKLFETGIRLSRECQERLNQAERRIEILLKDENGEPMLTELTPDMLGQSAEPKIRKRVVFEDEETPF